MILRKAELRIHFHSGRILIRPELSTRADSYPRNFSGKVQWEVYSRSLLPAHQNVSPVAS